VGYSEPQISYLEKNHRLPDVTTVTARFIPALDLEYESPLARRLVQLAETSRIEGQPRMEAPYKGLQFFDVQDADLFYGRELLTARLVRHLRKHLFLAIVVGASGSGKSSIVRAGLISALQRGKRLADGGLPPPGSSHWKYYVITPGSNPLESLITALEENEPGARALSKAVKNFTTDEASLDAKAKEILKSGKSNRDHLLLIVDQFEELFTLCEDETIRRAFIDNLMFSASPESGGWLSVVIALRADFYAHCAQYPNLRDALAHHQEYIGPMSREEIRRAIQQPALHAGLSFEPGLVDFILKEIGDEPGALPLLSHVMLETWKRRQNQMLTFRGYHQSGGIRGAIAKTAEDVYLKLDAERQNTARRIFLSLTELGQASEEGLMTPDSRRRVKLMDLIANRNESKSLEGLLKLLSDARLVIVTEDSVEVAHEALIREWPRLREWLSEDRENLLLHRQLNSAARSWDADGRKSEDLYRGSRLSQALEGAEKHSNELSALEKTFLDASKSFAERGAAKREAQRRKELQAAKRLAESESRRAEEQRHTSRRLRQRAWVLSTLLVIAGILALAALGLSRQRDEAAKLATSRELASASVSNLEVDPERSILLALEALSVANTREAEEALHRAVFTSRVEMTLRGHEGVVGVAVYSPDGSRIVTGGEDGHIRLWDSESGEIILILSGHEGPVYEVIFSPSGDQIASAGEDGTARIWDAATGELKWTFEGEQTAVVGLSFCPDEKRLATGGVDGSTILWDLDSGKQLHRLYGHDDVVISTAFTPDGKQLLTSGFDAKLIFWDAATGEMLQTWEGEFGDLVFSGDGKHLAAGSSQGGMIMDAVSGAELLQTGGHTNLVFTAAINPEWTRIATAGLDRKAIISDAETGRALFTLSGHTGEILDVHFSPDGKHLVTASADGTARVWTAGPAHEVLTIETVDGHGRISFNSDGTSIAAGDEESVKVWDVANGHERFSFEMPAHATGVAFDPTSPQLAGATEGGDVAIWNTQTGESEWKIRGSDRLIMFLAFSPDGRKVAGGGEENLVKVWDSGNGSLLLNLEGHHEPVTSVAFSPDGKRLASSGVDNIAIVWDTNTGDRLLTLSGHTDVVWGVAFSPDASRIASSSRDGTAIIWDAESGSELMKLIGHTSTVTSVFFSPDGERLATTSRDGLAKVWDARSGELLLTLYGNGEGVNGVTFSPDGKLLAMGGSEFLHIYLAQLDDLIALAKTRITRTLTEEECLQYLRMACP
jgi:WD40 repeat protein